MQADITTMSSKGQIVIPAAMRKGFKKGEKLLVLQDGKKLIVKAVSALDLQLDEDREFARRTEAAYQRYLKGQFKELPADEFFKEFAKW